MLRKSFKYYQQRIISTSCVRMSSTELKPKETDNTQSTGPVTLMKNPSKWERRFFVFVKRYKTVEDVPNSVSLGTLSKVKSEMRIKLCNIMIVGTILCSLIVALVGKKQSSQGDSITKRELEKIRLIKEKKL